MRRILRLDWSRGHTVLEWLSLAYERQKLKPFDKLGTVEEVAALCVFLASADSAYMTGSELTLDGGLLAGSAASPGS